MTGTDYVCFTLMALLWVFYVVCRYLLWRQGWWGCTRCGAEYRAELRICELCGRDAVIRLR